MIIGHVLPDKEMSLVDAYEKCRSLADPKVCCDYALHVGITWWAPKVSASTTTPGLGWTQHGVPRCQGSFSLPPRPRAPCCSVLGPVLGVQSILYAGALAEGEQTPARTGAGHTETSRTALSSGR